MAEGGDPAPGVSSSPSDSPLSPVVPPLVSASPTLAEASDEAENSHLPFHSNPENGATVPMETHLESHSDEESEARHAAADSHAESQHSRYDARGSARIEEGERGDPARLSPRASGDDGAPEECFREAGGDETVETQMLGQAADEEWARRSVRACDSDSEDDGVASSCSGAPSCVDRDNKIRGWSGEQAENRGGFDAAANGVGRASDAEEAGKAADEDGKREDGDGMVCDWRGGERPQSHDAEGAAEQDKSGCQAGEEANPIRDDYGEATEAIHRDLTSTLPPDARRRVQAETEELGGKRMSSRQALRNRDAEEEERSPSDEEETGGEGREEKGAVDVELDDGRECRDHEPAPRLLRYHRSFGDPLPESPKRARVATRFPAYVDGFSTRFYESPFYRVDREDSSENADEPPDFFASSPPLFPPHYGSRDGFSFSGSAPLAGQGAATVPPPSPPLSPVLRYEEEIHKRIATASASLPVPVGSPSPAGASAAPEASTPRRGSAGCLGSPPDSARSASPSEASVGSEDSFARLVARASRTADRYPTALNEAELLPPFANATNRRVHQEILELRAKTNALNMRLAERADRSKLVAAHLRQLRAEAKTLEHILAARSQSVASERLLADLHQRHHGKIASERKQLQGELHALQERLLAVQAEARAGGAEMDAFKLKMNWNEDELQQWVAAERQKERDRLEVERLQREDEREVKQLNLQVEKLSAETSEKKRELHGRATDAQALQVQLQTTAKHFRTIQQDRLQVIEQWEAALEGMRQRDEAIKAAAARYDVAQEEVRKKLDQLAHLRSFSADQRAANADLAKELQQLEKKIEKVQHEFAQAKMRLVEIHEAGEEARSQLSAAASSAFRSKAEIAHLNSLLEGKRQALDALTHRRVQMKKRFENELANSQERDDGLQQAEAFCRQVEALCQSLEKQLKKGRDELFEAAQQHAAQETLQHTTQTEIRSSEAALKNLGTQLTRLDQERQRQQELLYAVEYQSQLMQRKVSRAAGVRGVAEKKELKAKIEKLETILADQTQQCQMLHSQMKRLESELRKSQRVLQTRQAAAASLASAVADLGVECEFFTREVHNTQREKELITVEQDTLKLDARRLREQLRAQTEALTEAENGKLQTQQTIEEEILKAEHRLEIAKTAARAVAEERHRLALETASRKAKIANLESKYAVIVQKIKQVDGDGGTERSQVYYIIKAGQEKAELQRIGDELDRRIRNAESEIRALALTLEQLRATNGRFKHALSEETGFVKNQRARRDELEKRVHDAHNAKFEKHQHLQGLRGELEAERARMQEAEKYFEVLVAQKQTALVALEALRHEVAGQHEKLRRAAERHRHTLKRARQNNILPPHAADAAAPRPASPSFALGFDPTTQTNVEMEPHLESLKHHLDALRRVMAYGQ
ncbi:hypothetical protein BESB_039040 [Besnoitia besnoiti]|uniref:Uncharacterized protein n=1 Tax=Besnoitia besnoiti TaxID=94643 RepID=A0A2A9MMT1_BESBE|nr:hypothetical protein BESB_039040 [Besnoitia besnoiti]PFH37446.1 hypothetical protein BESB_039040 [Besnoitia besnoiti]